MPRRDRTAGSWRTHRPPTTRASRRTRRDNRQLSWHMLHQVEGLHVHLRVGTDVAVLGPTIHRPELKIGSVPPDCPRVAVFEKYLAHMDVRKPRRCQFHRVMSLSPHASENKLRCLAHGYLPIASPLGVGRYVQPSMTPSVLSCPREDCTSGQRASCRVHTAPDRANRRISWGRTTGSESKNI